MTLPGGAGTLGPFKATTCVCVCVCVGGGHSLPLSLGATSDPNSLEELSVTLATFRVPMPHLLQFPREQASP